MPQVVEHRLKTDSTQQPTWELEKGFRKALHNAFPSHWLAIHTSDTQQTQDPDYELSITTVREIASYMNGEHPTDNLPDTFRSAFPTVIWIPGHNVGARYWIKRIRTILKYSSHSELTAIATLDITNDLGDRTPPRDLLDEWMPCWWKNPPNELTHITPAFPHIRLRKCHRAERPHTDHNAMAYILHFQRTPPPPTPTNEVPTTTSFPEVKEPWFWMTQHIGRPPTLQLPPFFQIDCWSTDAQQIKLDLQDQQNTSTNRCTWTQ